MTADYVIGIEGERSDDVEGVPTAQSHPQYPPSMTG
jgi:hypothetical protein